MWGGLTQSERNALVRGNPSLKSHLIAESKSQGWWERRKSVDEILAPLLQQESESQAEFQSSGPVFEPLPDLIVPSARVEPQRILPTFDVPLEELLVEVPLPIVPPPSYAVTIQFPSLLTL